MPGEQPFIVEWPEEDLVLAARVQAEREENAAARQAEKAEREARELERRRVEAEDLRIKIERLQHDEKRRQMEEARLATEVQARDEACRLTEAAEAERRRVQRLEAERLRQEGATRQKVEARLVEWLRDERKNLHLEAKPVWGGPPPPGPPPLSKPHKERPILSELFKNAAEAPAAPAAEPFAGPASDEPATVLKANSPNSLLGPAFQQGCAPDSPDPA